MSCQCGNCSEEECTDEQCKEEQKRVLQEQYLKVFRKECSLETIVEEHVKEIAEERLEK
jgi:hypothetical protein